MKHFALLFTLFVAFSACLTRPNKNPLPTVEEPVCHISKIVSRDADSTYNYTLTYSYDSAGRLVQRIYYLHDLYQEKGPLAFKAVKTDFIYDAAGMLLRTETGKDHWTELTYNGDNVKELLVYKVEDKDTSVKIYTFTYQNGYPSQVSLKDNGENKGKVFDITFSGMNLQRLEQWRDDKVVEWHEYDSYDDTVSFFKPLAAQLFADDPDIDYFVYLSENNALHQDYGLSEGQSGWFVGSEYSLDEDGLLNRIVTKDHWNDIIDYHYYWNCTEN